MEKYKILIVDDNVINLKLLAQTLEMKGYKVICAENGKTACKLAVEEMPDLMLLDIMMPEMDGYSVCEWLKYNKKTKHIPIVFLTAKADSIDKVKGLELGAVDYITKPFDSVEIVARANNHIRMQKLHNQLQIKNKQLTEHNERIQKDIKAAGRVQRQLLPSDLHEIDSLKINWKFVPSSDIAGDIFNIIQVDEKHVAIYIIDVSGHGVQAALMSVLVHNFIRMGAERNFLKDNENESSSIGSLLNPANVAKALNQHFQMETYDAYFTCIYGVLNTETLIFKYVNAGHPHPLLITENNKIRYLDNADIPIGIIPDSNYSDISCKLNPKDKLILYTDGLYEIHGKNENIIHKDKLAELINMPNGDLDDKFEFTINEILKINGKSEFDDDVSLFGIEINK